LYGGDNLLGRGDVDVLEIDDSTVSRHHARITIQKERTVLEDLGSKNGTWLRDERATGPTTLTDGDVLRFGSAPFTLRIGRTAASPDSVPRAGDEPATSSE